MVKYYNIPTNCVIFNYNQLLIQYNTLKNGIMETETKNLEIQLASDSKLKLINYGIDGGSGTYRVITKCRAGFMISSDVQADNPYAAFSRYQTKSVHNISYVTKEDGYTFPVYARQGRKVWASKELLAEVTVGDINQDMSNTDLYSMDQYNLVNAKTWADKAFVQN